ncbi:MAG: putative toxin-antitoxin system toxin component, PIN family [Chromatiaceae bacterium]
MTANRTPLPQLVLDAQVPLRVVLDTNTLVSTLPFRNGRLSWLRLAWQRGDLIPLVCNRTVSELLRVLSYPKFRLGEPEIRDLPGDFLPFVETLSGIQASTDSPRCHDQNDQMFIELALAAAADALVTGDGDLLVLADTSAVPIIKPAELHRSQDARTGQGADSSRSHFCSGSLTRPTCRHAHGPQAERPRSRC